MKKSKTYIVTIRIVSQTGKAPDVRTICGDTVYIRMDEGQSARWNIKVASKRKRKTKV